MRWPEAMDVIPSLWKYLPQSHKFSHQLKRIEHGATWGCSSKSFELMKSFQFDLVLGFCSLVDIFIDRGFGPNFDVESEWDRLFVDRFMNWASTCLNAARSSQHTCSLH
jgi:hypothetical protein